MFQQPRFGQPGLVSEEERNRRLRELRAQRDETMQVQAWEQAMDQQGAVQGPEEAPTEDWLGPAALMSPQEPQEGPEGQEDRNLGDALADVGRAAVRGAAKAVDETVSFFTFGRYRPIGEENMPQVRSDHGIYKFIEGVSQFGVGMIGAGKVLKPLQLGRRAYQALRGAGVARKIARPVALALPAEAAGAITDFVAFDPYEERLSNLLAEAGPEIAKPVAEWFAASEDDPELWARTKASIEGAMAGLALGATIEGFTRMVRLSGIHKRFRRGEITAEETERLGREIADAEYEYDDAVAIWHATDGAPFIGIRETDTHVGDANYFVNLLPEEYRRGAQPPEGAILRHVTVNKDAVLREGLKSRVESGSPAVLGGDPGGISLTWDPAHAAVLETTLRTAIRAAQGKLDGRGFLDYVRSLASEGMDERLVLDQVATDARFSDEIYDRIIDRVPEFRDLHPLDQEEAVESYIARAIMGEDDDALVAILDDLFEEGAEYQLDLVRLADSTLPEGRYVYIDGETEDIIERFSSLDPDQVGTVHVLARKDVDPMNVSVRPEENEIAFRNSEDLVVVESPAFQSEIQAAALDIIIRAREGSVGKFPQAKIEKAISNYRKALEEGADPADLQKGWGLNLGLLVKSYDDFKVLSKSVERAMKKEHLDARFVDSESPKTFEELHERALAEFKAIFGSGATTEDLRAWAADLGSASLDEAAVKLDAGFMVLHALAGDISRVARALDLLDGPEKIGLQKVLEDLVETFAEIQLRVLGGRSEAGRLLNFMKKAGQTPAEMREAAQEALQAGARMAQERNKLTPAQARELARNLRLAEGDPEQIRKVLMHTADIHREWDKDPSLMDKINWFRTNMLLSGPKTQLINIINNAFTAFQVPVEHIWAGLRSGDRDLTDFGMDEIGGLLTSLNDSFRLALKTWRTKQNILDPTRRTDEGILASGPGPLGFIGSVAKNIVDLPGRALMAGDEFFKQLAYRSHVIAQAKMLAREDAVARGLKRGTKEFREYIAERAAEAIEGSFTEAGHALNPFALEHSRYVTFQTDLGPGTIGQSIQDLANRHPVIRFILPFVRTPVNLFRFAWQRTPVLGRFQHQMREDLAAGGHRAEIAKARLEAGWVIWGTGAILAMGNHITGAGPFDPNLRKQWRDLGNQPYSFRFPNGDQISFERLEPIGTALGILADAVEAAGELGEEDATQLAYAVAAAMASTATSKTFLMGLSEILEAVGDGRPEVVRKVLNNMATSFSPNFLNQINADEMFREARSLVDEFRRRLPGFSETLEPRRNLFGEPVLKPAMAFGMEFGGVGDYVNRSLNPFTTMKVEEDWETFQALTELGKALPYPQRTRMEGQIDLADRRKYDNGTGQSPYDRMFEIVSNPDWGPPLRVALREMVQSEAFQRLGSGNETFRGGGRYEMARRLVARYYRAAEKQVLMEYPKLREEMQALTERRIEGFIGTSQLERDEELLGF